MLTYEWLDVQGFVANNWVGQLQGCLFDGRA